MNKIEKENVRIEPPQILQPEHACYWYEKNGKGQLIGTQGKKVRSFIEWGLIEEIGNGKYRIKPLPKNKMTHIVDMNVEKCSCQASTSEGKECSHIKAVKVYIYMEEYNGRL